MELEKVILTDGDTVEIVLAKGTVTINSDGILKVDAVNYGFTRNLFEIEGSTTQNNLSGQLNTPYQPTKGEKVGQYLYMLFESQKCGHDVHTEIAESLTQYKAELGI